MCTLLSRSNGASWPIEYLVQIFEIFIIQEGNTRVDRKVPNKFSERPWLIFVGLHQTSVIYQDKSQPVQVYRQ
jgi:hypothetical protein